LNKQCGKVWMQRKKFVAAQQRLQSMLGKLIAKTVGWLRALLVVLSNRNNGRNSTDNILIDIPNELPLDSISTVTFYKKDLITVDLVCCEICIEDKVWTFHEEQSDWDMLINHLRQLPGFMHDWPSHVLIPAFAANVIVAYQKANVF
jgi:hypothetical protein